MAQRLIIIDAQSILNLLTHYLDGQVDLDADLRSAGVNQYFDRIIGLQVHSKHWDCTVNEAGYLEPLHVRYAHKKLASWTDKPKDPIQWEEAPEAPKHT